MSAKKPKTWKDEQRDEALRLFRIMQGAGDAGSEREFNCRRGTEQAGWMRLAAANIGMLISGQQLADVLTKHDIVDSQAVDDPEGYDNYKTLEAINMAARALRNRQCTWMKLTAKKSNP